MKTTDTKAPPFIYLLAGLMSVVSLAPVARGGLLDGVEKDVKRAQKEIDAQPIIAADPELVPFADGQSESVARVTWNGGTQHPHAQLRVRISGEGERLVDPQSKGSREVKVKAGKTYLYSVTDAGQRLAAVTVASDQLSGERHKKKHHHRDD